MHMDEFGSKSNGDSRSQSAVDDLTTTINSGAVPSLQNIASRVGSPIDSKLQLHPLVAPEDSLSGALRTKNQKPHPNGDAPTSIFKEPKDSESLEPEYGVESSIVPPASNHETNGDLKDINHSESFKHPTFEEYLAFRELSFEWADSYDTKDFDRLSKILAPNLNIDYSIVAPSLPKDGNMSAEAFLAFVSSPFFLGDRLIRTQHLLGASKINKLSEDYALGHIQIRAAHQREDETGKAEFNGHGHALLHHHYRRIDGRWLLAGVKPVVYWNEGTFEQIFRGSTS